MIDVETLRANMRSAVLARCDGATSVDVVSERADSDYSNGGHAVVVISFRKPPSIRIKSPWRDKHITGCLVLCRLLGLDETGCDPVAMLKAENARLRGSVREPIATKPRPLLPRSTATHCTLKGCIRPPDRYRYDTPIVLRDLCFRHRSYVKCKARDEGSSIEEAFARTKAEP